MWIAQAPIRWSLYFPPHSWKTVFTGFTSKVPTERRRILFSNLRCSPGTAIWKEHTFWNHQTWSSGSLLLLTSWANLRTLHGLAEPQFPHLSTVNSRCCVLRRVDMQGTTVALASAVSHIPKARGCGLPGLPGEGLGILRYAQWKSSVGGSASCRL